MTHAVEKIKKDYSSTTEKYWVIWDSQKKELVELTHLEFSEGLKNNWIKLRGNTFPIGNNDEKIWIDGILNN